MVCMQLVLEIHEIKTNFPLHLNNPVFIFAGEHKTDEYAAINPFQLVPALDDNGFKLTER